MGIKRKKIEPYENTRNLNQYFGFTKIHEKTKLNKQNPK